MVEKHWILEPNSYKSPLELHEHGSFDRALLYSGQAVRPRYIVVASILQEHTVEMEVSYVFDGKLVLPKLNRFVLLFHFAVQIQSRIWQFVRF